ncbi:MAG: CHAT domain-containing protein [Ferruginibacter sp.]
MRILTFFILFCICSQSLPGQCPGRDFLWNRIIYLRDSSETPKEEQLKELSGYLEKINQCPYKNDSTQTLLLQRIGWLYSTQNDFYNAILFTSKSISLINKYIKSPATSPKQMIKSYWNLNLLYDSLKLPEKKMAALDSCINASIRLKSGYEFSIEAIARRIKQLFERGDYYQCISYANLGESILQNNLGKIDDAITFSLDYFTWKINALILLNKTGEAEGLVKSKISECEHIKSIAHLGALYGLYATINSKRKNGANAILYNKKSFQINRQIKFSTGCAEALNNTGRAYAEILHQNKMALLFYFKALNYADPNEALNLFDNIGKVYVTTENFDSAFYFFQKALDNIEPGFSETSLLKKNPPSFEADFTNYISELLLDKADAWLKKYKKTNDSKALKEAIQVYKTADAFFDNVKNTQAEIQSKLFWKTNNRRLYEHAIEASYYINNVDAAFYFFEKSRSVLLNEQINEQKAMSEDDIARQAQVKKTILELENNLQKITVGSNEYSALQQQLFNIRQQLEILENTAKNKQPFYFVRLRDTASITIGQVRNNILKQHDLLVEIFAGDSAVYVLSISGKSQSFVKLNKLFYDSLTNQYLAFITHPELLNKDFTGFENISHQLFQLLFQKIAMPPSGRIIISPDGKSFPFEALVTNMDLGQTNYFLYNYACSYTYSAGYLANEFYINSNNSNGVLGIAPVKFNESFHLPALTGSDASLQNINTAFNTNSFVFDKATKNNFLQNFSHYPIIQLYTHASETSSNNEPVIYFADSALYLSELIASGKPTTQLVVLSACETANGKLYEGEGIFNFNRAFAAMGIPAAVSNLWAVDNQSTYRITELFYKYLAEGLPTDIALQKAKMAFIKTLTSKEKALPFFWAGTVLTGRVDTIQCKRERPWMMLLLLFTLIVLALFLQRKYIIK